MTDGIEIDDSVKDIESEKQNITESVSLLQQKKDLNSKRLCFV